MPLTSILTLIVAFVAALFAILAFLAANRGRLDKSSVEKLCPMIRDETDRVRRTIEEHSRATRQETETALARMHNGTLEMHTRFQETLSGRIDQFAARLDAAVRSIDGQVVGIGGKLDADIAQMATDAAENRERLRQAIDAKLDDAAVKHSRSSSDFRDAMSGNFESFRTNIAGTLDQISAQQRERLDATNTALKALIERNDKSQDALRQSVEGRLDAIRSENATKLEEMRSTVDEKLQSTLETRLGESFKSVAEQLERVHKGIGEMQSLATNVGDLKNVLTNVKVRGAFGEVQLALLLEDLLSPDQFVRDARVRADSSERVEFAVRIPRKDEDIDTLLPIDAKFPREDYERLQEAADNGDAKLIAYLRKELEKRIRQCAKDISEKYICPPMTTDWGILFLPTEGLYAEVLRQPGLIDAILRDFRVWIAGPTTLGAILNAFRAVYRSIAIERRSTEVWHLLGAIRTEFDRYNKVVSQIERQIGTAANSVNSLRTRTNVMTRKLRGVEALPSTEAAQSLLGLETADASDDGDDIIDEIFAENVVALTS